MAMNRSFLFLAVFSLAFFTACSDDAGPCDDGPSKSCLAGKWRLDGVFDGNNTSSKVDSETGNLDIESNGLYVLKGGVFYKEIPQIEGRILSIEGTTIKVDCQATGETLSGTITLSGDNTMNIKSDTDKALFSLYSSPHVKNPIERFNR
jgi:hypothetical protein